MPRPQVLQHRTSRTVAPDAPILSEVQLTPSLRTPTRRVRFSPDGKYILVEDNSTIFVLTRDPLAVRFQVNAQASAAATFSSDSSKLVIADSFGTVEWLSLPDGVLDRASIDQPCSGARFSADGDIYACIEGISFLYVYSLRQPGHPERVFSGSFDPIPFPFVAPLSPSYPVVRILHGQPYIRFSPDDHYIVASAHGVEALGVDLRRGKKIDLPPPLRRAVQNRSLEFVAPDMVIGRFKTAGRLTMASFPLGPLRGQLPFSGRCVVTSDPQRVLVTAKDAPGIKAVDWKTAGVTQEFQADGVDLLGADVVQLHRAAGEVVLSRLGEENAVAKVELPVSYLALPIAAAASGDLQDVAVSAQGEGGVFQTSTGHRIAGIKNLRGAWFDGNKYCYAETLDRRGTPALDGIDLLTGSASDPIQARFASISKSRLHHFVGSFALSGPVLAIESGEPGYSTLIRALEMKSGKQLWKRGYWHTPAGDGPEFDNPEFVFPRTFVDSQNPRIALGWYAVSFRAHQALKRASRRVQAQIKKAQLKKTDSFFEVLDAVSGTTVGGALVQFGAGPASFEGIFSAGRWFGLVSGGGSRFTVFSLSSGREVLHSFGRYAAISGQSDVLALAGDQDRVRLYNLRTGVKITDMSFAGNPIYVSFSEDGRRLLVVTDWQVVDIIDVSKLLPGAAPSQ